MSEPGAYAAERDDAADGPGADQASAAAEKIARFKTYYEARGRVFRVLFVGAGAIITLGGIAMLALPGPAFVVIPVGLAMLAVQFSWAESALVKALDQADKAQQKAKNASRTQKALGIAATVLGIAALVTCALLYDIPLIPDP